ncbi:unnamed protein product, partial [Vitis vinifera]
MVMDEEAPLSAELPKKLPAVDFSDSGDPTKSLTIKIASSSCKPGKEFLAPLISPNIKTSAEPSPYNSPSLISPPSSAFVSALQSPYISPRAQIPNLQENPTPVIHPSPPISYCGSQSDDIPSFPDPAPPRISFSFPVPRISFAKGSVSSASNAKLRSCDVYIGFHGQNPNLVRICKWLKSELELQGIACFIADRAKYSDNQSHEIADRVICSVTHGIVVVTSSTFLNHHSLEEIRFFAQKKNLIPFFFGTDPAEIMSLLNHNSIDKECKEAIERLMKSHEFKLEASEGNWRSCVSKAAGILRAKLGRRSVAEKEQDGSVPIVKGGATGQCDGFADEESDAGTTRGEKYINLEVGKCKEPTLEAWVEPVVGRSSLKRPKYKKSKSGNYKSFGSSVICINGGPGVGKTELALEFAYRYSQRYKMVLWVGGEARYFRQSILNLSLNLGLDVSADAEKERGRIRSFEEQEFEAFKRVKRELFRDMPYLLIIDNLETEKEWWEGKDLHDLIPRNTGGSHVIVTTRLSKKQSFSNESSGILLLCFTTNKWEKEPPCL